MESDDDDIDIDDGTSVDDEISTSGRRFTWTNMRKTCEKISELSERYNDKITLPRSVCSKFLDAMDLAYQPYPCTCRETWLPDGYSQILRLYVLALRASGLWLRYATLQNLIPSYPWIAPPRPPPWRNPRKGRDKILPSGNHGLQHCIASFLH